MMSSFTKKMSVIEEKIESSDEDVSTLLQNKRPGKSTTSSIKVRFDESTTKTKSYYIAIEGNLTGTDTFIFGLKEEDVTKIIEIFPRESEIVINGLCVEGAVIDVVNTLHSLGYLVVDVAGSSTKTWTMVKHIDK